MKTVEITENMYCYPPPEGKKQYYAQGDKPQLEDDYADLLVRKGQAKATESAEAPAAKTDPEA